MDYNAAVLVRIHQHQHAHSTHLVVSNIIAPVRAQLDHYEITNLLGADAYFDTAGQALEAFHHTRSTEQPS